MRKSILFILIVLPFFPGCTKDDKRDLNEKYSFTGTIDSNSIRWEVKAVDNTNDTSKCNARAYYYYGQLPLDCSSTDCYDVKAGVVVGERLRNYSIQVMYLRATRTGDVNQLKPFFTPGFMPFGSQRSSIYTTTQNGVIIRYIEDGRIWTSEQGDQTGSTFESVEFKDATIEKDIYSNIWRARFSCKVYFSGLPPKTLENCEIEGPAFYK